MAFEIKVVHGNRSVLYRPTHISIKEVWPNSPAGRWYLSMLDMTDAEISAAVNREEVGEIPGTYIELCGLDRKLFPNGSITVHIPGDNPAYVPADAVYSLRENGDTKDKWPSAAMRTQLEMVKDGWRPDRGEAMPEHTDAELAEIKRDGLVKDETYARQNELAAKLEREAAEELLGVKGAAE
jgi:hypothetical protein